MEVKTTVGTYQSFETSGAVYLNNVPFEGGTIDAVILKNKHPWMVKLISNANEGDEIILEGWIPKDESRGKKLILTTIKEVQPEFEFISLEDF